MRGDAWRRKPRERVFEYYSGTKEFRGGDITPTAESHGFSPDLLWSGCRTAKSRRSRSESAKLSGAIGFHVGLHMQSSNTVSLQKRYTAEVVMATGMESRSVFVNILIRTERFPVGLTRLWKRR